MSKLMTRKFDNKAMHGVQLAGLVFSIVLITGCETPKPVPVSIPGGPTPIARAAVSGVAQYISDQYSINPDCTSAGIPTTKILEAPKHGTITFVQESGYTNFAKDNQRFECNKQKSPMVKIIYTSNPDFVGSDSTKIMTIYPGGTFRNETYEITVK